MLDSEKDSINRVSNNNNSVSLVNEWLEEEFLCDVYQTMNPEKTVDLVRHKPKLIASQLDMFFSIEGYFRICE